MLAPDGGLGLMVCGEPGRTGVYPARDLLRLVAPAERRDTQRPATARRLLASLQPTNRLRRNDLVATIWREAMPASTTCCCMPATAPSTCRNRSR